MPGYSGKPLSQKLGLKHPLELVTIDAPAEYLRWLGDLPDDLLVTERASAEPRAVHLFSSSRRQLARELERLRSELAADGFVWVSWPKKASRVPTDITEDVIREIALPLGFVDIKVCAVSEVWSGLKLVIRKELRAARGDGQKS